MKLPDENEWENLRNFGKRSVTSGWFWLAVVLLTLTLPVTIPILSTIFIFAIGTLLIVSAPYWLAMFFSALTDIIKFIFKYATIAFICYLAYCYFIGNHPSWLS